jgi:hypothetical protein
VAGVSQRHQPLRQRRKPWQTAAIENNNMASASGVGSQRNKAWRSVATGVKRRRKRRGKLKIWHERDRRHEMSKTEKRQLKQRWEENYRQNLASGGYKASMAASRMGGGWQTSRAWHPSVTKIGGSAARGGGRANLA